MANRTITHTAADAGATLTNATDGAGTPSQDGNDVTVVTSNASVSGVPGGAFFDVSFAGGADTLIAGNMPWVNDSGDSVGFDNIDMGAGDDYVELTRSGFRDVLDMGDGADTLHLMNSSGRDVVMGSGDDITRVDLDDAQNASDEELAQKVGQAPTDIDGGGGTDSLHLTGDWTLTLGSGNATLDTDGNGTGDLVTNTFSSAQFTQVIGLPALLSGTVQWGDTITISGGDTVVPQITFSNFEHLDVVCFTKGTMIEVPEGAVPIETLVEGDIVLTRNGPKKVRWVGRRRLDLIDLMANPKLLPIRLPAGSFGKGLPHRDVRFSPQHRIVVRSKIAQRLFNVAEVLVPAKLLVGYNGIDIDGDVREIVYRHIMLDDHDVVRTEGIEAETLLPGPQALKFLSKDALAELQTLFPDVLDTDPETALAGAVLPILKGRDARALVARHIKNAQPIYS